MPLELQQARQLADALLTIPPTQQTQNSPQPPQGLGYEHADEELTQQDRTAIRSRLAFLDKHFGVPVKKSPPILALPSQTWREWARSPTLDTPAPRRNHQINHPATMTRQDIRALGRETALGLPPGPSAIFEFRGGDVKQLNGFDPPRFRYRANGCHFIRLKQGEYAIEVTRVRNRG